MKANLFPLGLVLAIPFLSPAQQAYQKPPQEVLDVLNAPVTPEVLVSPARDRFLLVDRELYPSIAELARPMFGLAGLRIDPQNNGPHRPLNNTGITIQTISTGGQIHVKLPPGARLGPPVWSPDGKQFAFEVYQQTRVELWVADAQNGRARKLDGIGLSAAQNTPFRWMHDSRTLLCKTVPGNRGPAPMAPAVPPGPNIQESYGKSAPIRTYEDLLKNSHDESLFEYYLTSQIVLVDTANGRQTKPGKPDLYDSVEPSPNGQYLLVSIFRKPFSRLLPAAGFARDVTVWDGRGNTVLKLASLPSHEGVPIDGVPTGPRNYHWRPTADATLVWAEALDGGNPKTKVPHRDHLLLLKAPFKDKPTEFFQTEYRYTGIIWGENEGMALVSENDRDRRWTRTFLIKVDQPDAAPRLVWDRSASDRYGNPGTPVMRTLPTGERVIWQTGKYIYLDGAGASSRGDFPFLDRFDLDTFKAERLFQCDNDSYESVVGLLDDPATAGLRFITRHETPDAPPNYLLRTAGDSKIVALTQFTDPTPQLRKITKRLVTYKRDDGVQLSFTLYLPPDYKPGTRLPTVVWAYPREFNDAGTAGQVSGSANRFTTITGPSHLFFLLEGYAVLDNATMPIVGPPETMNDTFIEQIVASAKAAIAKAVEMGVTDPNRVGVGGHSYGAFMTANLLAHCDLFRAGIALSGAYNRTLTPFGFQSERRTLWEAPETYVKLSPILYANQFKAPILLIHGEADDNEGTFPIQSQRLYQAIKGNGGNVRYVTLPYEAHSYAGKETIEHTLREMITWFDTNVKNAPAQRQ